MKLGDVLKIFQESKQFIRQNSFMDEQKKEEGRNAIRKSISQQENPKKIAQAHKRASNLFSKKILNEIQPKFQVKEPSPQNLASNINSKVSPTNLSNILQDPSIIEENLRLAELKRKIKANHQISEKRLQNRKNKYRDRSRESLFGNAKHSSPSRIISTENLFKYTQVEDDEKKKVEVKQTEIKEEEEELAILQNTEKFVRTKDIQSSRLFQKQLNKLDKQIQALNSKAQNFFKSEILATHYQTIKDFSFQLYNESKLSKFSTRTSRCPTRSKSQSTNRRLIANSERGTLPSVQSQRTVKYYTEKQQTFDNESKYAQDEFYDIKKNSGNYNE